MRQNRKPSIIVVELRLTHPTSLFKCDSGVNPNSVARAQLVEQQANLQKLLNGNRPEDIAAATGQLAEQQANLQKVLNGN